LSSIAFAAARVLRGLVEVLEELVELVTEERVRVTLLVGVSSAT
jgi:hypothetical protein